MQREWLYTRLYITQRKSSGLSMLTKPEQEIDLQTLIYLPDLDTWKLNSGITATQPKFFFWPMQKRAMKAAFISS